MCNLDFESLDRQIASVRTRMEQIGREREEWNAERRRFEERVRALEEEIARLAESEERYRALLNENEQYRKSQRIVREQVVKMLQRIDTFARP